MGSIRSYWGNPYHLLCASPFYFSIFFENTHGLNPLLLGKSLSFTMCFPTLFPDGRTGETPTIYYVLPHSIPRFSLKTRMGPTRSYWGNPYHLLCASPSDRAPRRAHCHWGNLYYLLCASPAGALPLGKPLLFTMCFPIGSCSPAGALPLGNPLLFCMCFPIVFFGERIAIGETSTIWWVLPQLSMFEAWHRP